MSLMKYKTNMILYNSYFDLNNRLTTKSILSIFQDIASIHAEELGVGYLPMLEKNLYWVLSRVKFDILKMPDINQEVVVETWPHLKGRIDFDRDLKISNLNGEVLVIATSKWCVIDITKRMLQRTDNINYLGEYCLDVNYKEKFEKISLPDSELKQAFTHIVRFSDLDHNQHMNNTNYASLVLNAIENKNFSHFEINFLSECKLNDEILVFTIKDNQEEFVLGKVNEKIAFIAYIK